MNVSHLLDTLNQAQREAVTAPPGHVLVLAGAGTGKTKVLTHRIAWLLATEQARAHNILAVTFTNKAAREMRTRLETLLNNSSQNLWANTFHSIAHLLLRKHWQLANLPQTFQIIDSDDQLSVLKQVIKSLELDDKVLTPRQAQHFINTRKDHGLRAKDLVAEEGDAWRNRMLHIYTAYEARCQQTGSVDFAELLLRCYELWRDNPSLLAYYQQRFQYILVDEFQDTNPLQYNWLQLLAGQSGQLFVVGDDDQSIYGFRNASAANLANFNQEFPQVQLIRLEQNYRSTGTILEVANTLIARNDQRLGKNLWTQASAGEPIFLYTAYSEMDEARFVAEKVQAYSGQRREIAILYRTTAQSRLFEEELLQRSIPYRIYGSLRFYERLEIKDMLAYLRLLHHRDDDSAFERIVNTPKRGIGERTLETLRGIARQQEISLWQAAQHAIETQQLKARASSTLTVFLDLIQQVDEQIKALSLHEKIKHLKTYTGLVAHYQKESKEEAQRRLENLDELINAARQFEQRRSNLLTAITEANPSIADILTEFLAHTALEAGEGQGNEWEDCVQLMTLHAAKGLEFEIVFLVGLEENLFPHQNSLDESKLEEERRLCYVGITRARRYLYLCHSETRYRYGNREFGTPSRFIREMPTELIQAVRLSNSTVSPLKSWMTSAKGKLHRGERVKHKQFGEGVVLNYEGQGDYARVQIKFASGNKWLMMAYAQLEKLY